MKLLIDIGNTRTKWRCLDGGCKLSEGVFKNSELTEDAISGVIEVNMVKKVLISNVGKSEITSMFLAAAGKLSVDCQSIQSAKEMAGLKFSYDEVASLGVDRCLAMIGAYSKKAVLVIDAGSAITADYLNEFGEHLGGYIFPGCSMLMLSLKKGTSKVLVDAEVGNNEPGQSTKMCVNNGFTLMVQSLLNGLLAKASELGINEIVVTGGDADLFVRACPDRVCCTKSNLVLDGMEKLLNGEEI